MKQLLFILLFTVSLTSFAKQDLYNLLKDPTINLAYDVKLPDAPKFNDFSQVKIVGSATYNKLSDEPVLPYVATTDLWYYSDFASEPFDGRIEMFVIGEPLPTTIATLVVTLLLGCVIYYRKQYASIAQ